MNFEQIIARVRRALMLDATAFEEVRDDAAFTPVAAVLAVVAILLGALGTFFWSEVVLDYSVPDVFVEAVIIGTILLALLWALGIAVTYGVLTQLYKETLAGDVLGLMRVAVLGHLPFAICLLVFIPGLGFGFAILGVCAMFFYTIFGLRAAYPAIDPFRVMVAVAAGFAVWLMILPLLTSHDNAWAPGLFLYEYAEDVLESFGNVSVDLGDLNLPTE